MLSGTFRAEIEACLSEYTSRGAKVVTPVQKIGSRWAAACTLPPKRTDADTTTSLSLSELAQDVSTPARKEPEHDDGCTVQELGFKRVISGPSRHAVQSRIDH